MSPLAAQDISVWLDASTSHARPPAGVTADPAQYGLLGGRLGADFAWGSLVLGGRYGEAFWGSEGRWLQGEAAVSTGGRVGRAGVRAVLSTFGLRYYDPFRYEAGGFELRPSVSVPAGPFILSALPRVSLGAWTNGDVRGELEVAGGELEIRRSFGPVRAAVSGGATTVANGTTAGTFTQGAASLALDRGTWAAEVRLQAQHTPLETELGGGVRLTLVAAPGMELHAYGGQTLRDPLFGTAGSLGFSISATVRALRWSPAPPPPVAAVGERESGGRVVRFAIRAPEARTVELTGAFTDWEPIAMEEGEGGWWRVQRTLPPGLHHFGFLVDGKWAIPQDAPGVVDDGWGRRNASIVVDP